MTHHPTGDDALERAAAELTARLAEDAAPMPAALQARIAQVGRRMVETGEHLDPSASDHASAGGTPDAAVIGRIAPAPAGVSRTWWAGWAAAAAALVAWFVIPNPMRPSAGIPSPAELRASLIADSTGTMTLDWSATQDPAAKGAAGNVVWNGSRQAGVMRIRGLAPNDPRVAQYQLWIFDATRNERYPVDGGVFDVTTGEVLVPINARLPVREPVMFAVTVEPPGGVVVSSRERIVLVAQVRG